MSELPPLERDYYLLFAEPGTGGVLLLDSDGGWDLPHFRSPVFELFSGETIRQEIARRLALEVSVVRVAQVHIDPVSRRWTWALIELENDDPDWTPPAGARWAGRAELDGLTLAQPEQCEGIAAWLAEQETGEIPERRPAWQRLGWQTEARRWVETILAQRGLLLEGRLEQVKSWGISCLLRGHTSTGDVYLKACPTLPLFTNEPAITVALAAQYPTHVPVPLAVDAARRWMLLADFGGCLLKDAPVSAWDETVRVFARIQREAAGRVDALLAAGCLDRRLRSLAGALPRLLEDAEAFGILDAAELEKLRAGMPLLEAMCDELAGYRVPETLVHGDLHDENVAIRDGAPLYFDWSDSCVAHPFFDLVTLFGVDYRQENPAERTRVRDLYLAEWAGYEPPDRLSAAADLAERVGLLHHSISYQHIVTNMEPSSQWELTDGWAYYARRLVDAVRTPIG